MALSKAQHSIIEKARSVGGGRQGVVLSDSACSYLVGVVAQDLGVLESFPELPGVVQPFFDSFPVRMLEIAGVNFISLAERLFDLAPDADTYFASLAKLHKARLKYERILETQPIPTVEQVGPRALLEFGKFSSKSLAALLFWRKWIFDVDNRSAQELNSMPSEMPSLCLSSSGNAITVQVGSEYFVIDRKISGDGGGGKNQLPQDIDEELPG